MTEDFAREKARNARWKRPALACLGSAFLQSTLDDIINGCDEVVYYMDYQRQEVIDLMGEDEFLEYHLAFCQLRDDAEQLGQRVTYDQWDDRDNYDDLTLDLIISPREYDDALLNFNSPFSVKGYDTYEQDWYTLRDYEQDLAQRESYKRLMKKTKAEIISCFRDAFGVFCTFYGLMGRYEALRDTMDLLAGNALALMDEIKRIDRIWEAQQGTDFPNWDEFDRVVSLLPDSMWVE